MVTLLYVLMLLSGLLFILSVALMAPKGGLGFGIGGMSTSNEYGSKKSLEWTLKKTAFISIIVFTLSAMVYPFAAKKQLATWKAVNIQTQNQPQGVKLQPQTIKVEWQNTKNIEIKTENVNPNSANTKENK